MPPKKDNNRVMDMLEKMGMFKKLEEDTDYIPEETEPLDGMTDEQELQEPGFDYEEPAYAPVYTPAAARPSYETVGETPYGIPAENKQLFTDDSSEAGPSVDRYQNIDQIYQDFGMKVNGVDTIYLIESYINTLPETLPAELRRSIILKIVSASGFDFDFLLNDGIDRVAQLNDYTTQFAARTEEIVERHNLEIDALERQIQQIRELINERKNLHKRQFLTIESEAQRLRNVLDFITK